MTSEDTWILGIDEAGRGPVLGPMVYGCALCRHKDIERLNAVGFGDSKQLKEEVRDALFETIQTSDFLKYMTHVISPEEISDKMLSKFKTSLNVISHESAMSMIRKALDAGLNVTECYLDTVGDSAAYVRMLAGQFSGMGIKFVVESKADDTYPIVGAASVCAKVTRDSILAKWIHRERREFPKELGCGYPGDAKTKSFLQESFDPVFGFPTLVRHSWGTATKIIEDKGFAVSWSDAVAQNSLAQFGFGVKKGATKCPYYKKHCMEPAGLEVFA